MHGLLKHTLALAVVATYHGVCASDAPTIRWESCDGIIPMDVQETFGAHLQCGQLTTIRDHGDSSSPAVARDVIRIRATLGQDTPPPTLFVDFGRQRFETMPSTVLEWRTSNADDPETSGFRKLVDRFDIVFLSHRGDTKTFRQRCGKFDYASAVAVLAMPPESADHDTMWDSVIGNARDIATRCAPVTQEVDTWQQVRDMDDLRRALGVERLDLYGQDLGARVLTTYAVTFPQHAGRLLLQGAMDFTDGLDAVYTGTPYGLELVLWRNAFVPAANDEGRWKLGGDPSDVRERFMEIPFELRYLWSGLMRRPEHIRTAIDIAHLYLMVPVDVRGRERLIHDVASHRFADDPAVDALVRKASRPLVERLPREGGSILDTFKAFDGSYIAPICNDARWKTEPEVVRDWLTKEVALRAAFSKQAVEQMLVCSQWPAATHEGPSLDDLRRIPAFVVMHDEENPWQPLWNIQQATDKLPNATLVVRESAGADISDHRFSCYRHLGTHYLLTGELPGARKNYCSPGDPQPRTASRHER
ncbi:MAG: hypothetical protein GAK28_02633 [Luteibacter sp.]|uniref:alpha/beta hydrolase n=1 Tax=Luteibacter sp. TaxID=1886636 RepID=UPI00138005FF|nr:alpha/beta hydrolase [Luteibacter sp.]KAF1006322.1 MAG: hypothetical protein GAK28_02633 [Luteibacter sp.]